MLSKIRHYVQKQPFIGVLKKKCSENMHQIYRRMPMPQCDFSKVACNFTEIVLWHGCSPVNLLHISRTPFPKNNSGWLLLYVDMKTLKTIYHAIFESRPLHCFGRKKSSSVKRLHILQKKSLRLMFFLKQKRSHRPSFQKLKNFKIQRQSCT